MRWTAPLELRNEITLLWGVVVFASMSDHIRTVSDFFPPVVVYQTFADAINASELNLWLDPAWVPDS